MNPPNNDPKQPYPVQPNEPAPTPEVKPPPPPSTNPDPKTHPIHPAVPIQPIHEGTDPKRPVTR